ncbi:unnamed protein product [Diamesa hyperborea]
MERKRSVRRRQKPPFAERAKDHCRKFTAFMFSNVGIIFLVVLYTIAGAFMFMAIEGGVAMERKANAEKARNETANNLWDIYCCKYNGLDKEFFMEAVEKEMLKYQLAVVERQRKGIVEDGEQQWSFSGAFLYSLTVITTIGYGNIAPSTEWGKITTIFYAIIGMPLFLLYLSNIGDILAKSFKWIYAKCCLCRICPKIARRRMMRERKKLRMQTVDRDFPSESGVTESGSASSDEIDDDIEDEIIGDTQAVTVPITICLTIMIGYILLGAALFANWEQWDLLDGSYFCFISLSSIGFGDIVPGSALKVNTNVKDYKFVEWTFILCAVYLLLGMALIAMCFNLMQEQVIFKLRSLKRCARQCFRCKS